MAGRDQQQSGERGALGFALLEVVVAIGLLAISTLAIAGTLGAAVRHAGAAETARRALAAAAAVADTAGGGATYPTGWRPVGSAGTDGLPGSADDGGQLQPPCQRRIAERVEGSVAWLWIEVSCDSGARMPAGGGGRKIRLVVAR